MVRAGYVEECTGDRRPGNPGGALKHTARVVRVSADFKQVDVVVDGLGAPAGISFGPGNNPLYVSEYSGNRLLSISLLQDGITVNPVQGAAK